MRVKLANVQSLSLGSVPANEDCAQVGCGDYASQARRECVALINQLRREHGKEPCGAFLKIQTIDHEWGQYLTVVCEYDRDNGLAAAYARACNALPATWDREAGQELKRGGYLFPASVAALSRN